MIIFNVLRADLLSENDRKHWAAKAPVISKLRQVSKIQHKSALKTGTYRPLDHARLVVHIAWPDGRRRDRHNILPTIKALIDGAVDAGLIPDDDDKHLDGPDLRTDDRRCGKPYAARLEFVWTDVEETA